ncbi:CHAD domain-containing protein [Rhizobium sp. LjRoot254]|uniref:CHAD domain-containing protein n=1 Tax=Rhizobium sp. LjRoot254 TaxID=3342297 RepID=UPI003ECE108E
MEYDIDFAESLESQVRRIARHRLEDAASLLDDMPDGPDHAIHGARKHIKQCRALYRLVADSAKEFQRAENQRLGDIARELSHLRDAAALMQVTQYLKHEINSKSNAMLMDRLAKRLERRHRRLTGESEEASEILHKASGDLRQAASDVNRLDLPNGPQKGADCVVTGWEKVGKKARRAIAAAASGHHEEAFHDLRKRSQDRWMHAALISDLWPTAMISIQRQAKSLSDLLGHMQDLSVLDEAITTAPELVQDNVENEAVRDAIRTQQAKLREESLDQAGDLFRKSKPRDGKVIGRLIRKRAGE